MGVARAVAAIPEKPLTQTKAVSKSRISSIDVMRGLVIVLMLVDHVREKLYLHVQVSDPMDVANTSPDLFFTRMSAHLCAPAFVFLTGMSAWLYSHPASGQPRSATGFLFKRGLFLVVLELTLINFSWFGTYTTLYLQVIWAIGLSMIALSLLVRLQFWLIATTGAVIVVGHNLLTPITFQPGETGYTLWTILHDRGYLIADGPLKVKVSYPVLPWIGVILLGYTAGPLYARAVGSASRIKMLLGLGGACLGLLLVLRGLYVYGETLPWAVGDSAVQTVMSFVNFTKYPPSLSFLLLTLGVVFLLLAWFERLNNGVTRALEVFGSAPMFFYAFHLYVLLIGYNILLAVFGPTQGEMFGVDDFWWVWVTAALMTLALYYPTRTFARFKQKTKQGWVRYF
jgi:uncharacterized membrane protein